MTPHQVIHVRYADGMIRQLQGVKTLLRRLYEALASCRLGVDSLNRCRISNIGDYLTRGYNLQFEHLYG
jgi:hypothetical protein